ncbi:MAG: hypothetical protein MUE50_27190, partial [Pirellulaceae bacterium]|nr:hypothetical protein [Pirellulaceae bacterium]
TPVSERLAREFLLLGRTMAILDNPAARGCLKCLATEDHPQVRRAAEQLLAELDHPAPRTPNPGIPRLPPVPFEADPKRVRFEPVEIIYERDKPRQRGAPAAMAGCVPAGPGVDLIWESWQYLYVMKEPGRLKRIWDAGYKNSRGTAITGVRFDGRWAWITTESGGGQPRLLILDPQQERIWEVGERNGLPLASYESLPDRFPRPRLWAEPIEPGRALLVSYFGRRALLVSYFGRMALATVTFSPASGAKVDVFFEARQQPDPTVLQAWFNPRLAFAPAYVFAFAHQSEQGPAERRVVIGGRSQPDDHPLVVDPGTREVRVQVFGLEQGIDASWHAVTQSAVYQLVCSGDLTRHLARVGLPKFRLEYLLSGVPAGRCVAYEGRILIAGQQWWQLDPQADPDHRIRLLTTSLPWTEPFIVSPRQATNQPGGSLSEAERYRLEMLCQSNHFGLLAVRRAEKPPNPCEFFRVVFQGPQTPSPPLATSR